MTERLTRFLLHLSMLLIIFPLMYTLIALALITDYMQQRRLRKHTSGAIQEPSNAPPAPGIMKD